MSVSVQDEPADGSISAIAPNATSSSSSCKMCVSDADAAVQGQIDLLSAIKAGPGSGIAAEAIAAGDSAVAQRKLTVAAIFCVIFMVLEALGGYAANSLAIMTDAAHLLADLAGFLISVFALWLSSRPPTEHLSFGWYRLEIIGALLSVVLIWVVTGFLFVEAYFRLENPKPVNGKLMMLLAACGLVVNALIALVLHSTGHSHGHSHGGGNHGHSHGGNRGHSHGADHGHSHGADQGIGVSHEHSHSIDESHDTAHNDALEHHQDGVLLQQITEHSQLDNDLEQPLIQPPVAKSENVNVRAAMIHAIGDMVQSGGVMVAAGLVWYHPKWVIVDPLCTFLFGFIVLYTTVGLLRECIHVLMEGAPTHINNSSVRQQLKSVAHVRQVHDLHIWSIKQGKTSLSVHLEVDKIGHQEAVLQMSQKILREQFGITHSTIQIEPIGDDCASDCV